MKPLRAGRLRLAHWQLGLPDDAEVAGVHYDKERRTFVVSFTHDSLIPIDELYEAGFLDGSEWPDVASRSTHIVYNQIVAKMT